MMTQTQALLIHASKDPHPAGRRRIPAPAIPDDIAATRAMLSDYPTAQCGTCALFQLQLGVLPYCASRRIAVMRGAAPCGGWRPRWESEPFS